MKEPKKPTDDLSEEVRLQIARNLYKESYFDFFCDAISVLEPRTVFDTNFHHQYIADILQHEAWRISGHTRKTCDYNINVPPRSSKSLLVSVIFPAWVWSCVSAHISFMYISHTESLALTLASKTKNLIESEWFKRLYPDLTIRPDTSAKGYYMNNSGGVRMSFGAQGAITGDGGDFLIIDDFHKPQDTSVHLLQSSINTYKETIYSRLNNPSEGVRFNIGQRTAESDLSGFIKANNDGSYRNICLPAELTEDVSPPELRQYYQDGLFWKSRFSDDVLNDLRGPTGIGEFAYATQYLQRPAPVGGGMIKKDWFDMVDSAPAIQYHLFIDTAQTAKLKNDPSAIMVAGVHENTIYVKKVYELWLEFPELLRKIKEVASSDGDVNTKIYIEPKANGLSVVQALRKETMLNVIELPTSKDSKVKRVQSITPKLEGRRVKLVRDKDYFWNDNFIFQASAFPAARHDDQIDVLFYCVNTLLSNAGAFKWYM